MITGRLNIFRKGALREAFNAGVKSALANSSNWRDMFEAGEKKGSAWLNEAVNAPGFHEIMAGRRENSPGSFNSWFRKQVAMLGITVNKDKFELIAMETRIEIEKGTKMITLDAIEEAVRHVFNISIDDLRYNPRRKDWIKTPRFYAWYLAYHHCKETLGEMGQRWGGRIHATALHGAKTVYQNCSLYSEDKTKLRLLYKHLEREGYGMHFIFDYEDYTLSRTGADRNVVGRVTFKTEEI